MNHCIKLPSKRCQLETIRDACHPIGFQENLNFASLLHESLFVFPHPPCNPFCVSVDMFPALAGWYNLPILMTRLWAEWLMNWNSVPSMDRDFIYSQQHSDWFWSPPSLLFSRHRDFPRVKHPGYEAEYSPASSAKVKNPQNYSFTLLYFFVLMMLQWALQQLLYLHLLVPLHSPLCLPSLCCTILFSNKSVTSWLHRTSTMLNPFITNWCTLC